MPVRRRAVRVLTRRLTAAQLAVLTDEPDPPVAAFLLLGGLLRFSEDTELARLWRDHRATILARWVTSKPGTRPRCWWHYDAPRAPVGTYPGRFYDGLLPEPRRRIGGVGTPAHEASAYFPEMPLGVPIDWVTVGGRGVPIDPADPPTYEAQATYLQRHGFLLPAEARRLTADDFAPELVLPPDDEAAE